MDTLGKIERLYLKDLVFIALLFLYVFGPLEFVSSFIPTLWSLPAIFVLSAIVWKLLEAKLSQKRIRPDGKAIFISGCDSGFGFELAKRMATKGYDVYAGCLFPDGDGAKALAEVSNIHVVGFDVTKDDSIAGAVSEIKHRLQSDKKTLWGVVANAGIGMIAPIEWSPMEDIQRLFDVNVFGVVRTVKAFLPLLRGSGGRFVITSSLSGLTGCQLLSMYSMTKSAVKNLTESLRKELGEHSKVYFTCLMPGIHRTPILEKMNAEELERRFNNLPKEEQTPANRRYLTRCMKEQKACISVRTTNDLSGVLESFDHALTSTRPQPRYICDQALVRYIVCPIIDHFPIETTDFLYTKPLNFSAITKYFTVAKSNKAKEG